MKDFLFRGTLEDIDPKVHELTQLEAERQYRKLILIPSESQAPMAVREAMASAFQNIYAEGYPREETRWLRETEILDYPAQLTHYRRYSDRRYYKGVEYVNVAEELARRRCAELFANEQVIADSIYVNVQPLSGSPANNAVYHALLKPGETIMGMDLLHGGHLTHGSPVNRSGKLYNAVYYTVDPKTEQLNYDMVAEVAVKHHPRIIIAGYSSYPWAVDWKRFREIADSVGALLFADIAHVAGLVAANEYPSPVGYADVVTFTTHKSLCGPRGACILTFNERLSQSIDRAVFPGEQGGPHVNTFVGMAVAFKIATTEQFRLLQNQVVKNCVALSDQLQKRNLKISYGGTNTHLLNLACNTIVGTDGTALSGEMAARILDIAGIVVNRNTIPGDISAVDPSGIRMGTPWITQRGFKESETKQLADIIADILLAMKPHQQLDIAKRYRRAKVDFETLEQGKLRVRDLAISAGIDFAPAEHGYPHFYYIDEKPAGKEWSVLNLSGDRVRFFLDIALGSDVEALQAGHSQPTIIHLPKESVTGTLTCISAYEYRLTLPVGKVFLVAAWLRDLTDGYITFDQDVEKKLPGLTEVELSDAEPVMSTEKVHVAQTKPFFIGIGDITCEQLPEFTWVEKEAPLRRTPVYETHHRLGAKIIPFAGWEMPVWYTSVVDEHLAVRQAAGIFDVAHMGVYQAEGPDAAAFLDSMVANDASYLKVGESCYTHLLDLDADVIDDLIIYRRAKEKFLVVVNASNDDKDWAWLNAAREGKVMVDRRQSCARVYGRGVILRNLRNPAEGKDMRVDIALQGPKSRATLLALGCDKQTYDRVRLLKRTHLCEGVLGGFDLIISRTGYTGENLSFELFVHPDQADALFNRLLEVGKPFGIKPIGLGARDSLRTEAGLPLYGHEMGGELNLGPGEAGFGAFVKTYKAWFVGREAYIEREAKRKGSLIRFRFNEKGVRMAHLGDPVVDKRGKLVGNVTSCAIDTEGFLTGQAYVENKYSDLGTGLYIYQGAKEVIRSLSELRQGDRVTLPSPVTVIRRFPKQK